MEMSALWVQFTPLMAWSPGGEHRRSSLHLNAFGVHISLVACISSSNRVERLREPVSMVASLLAETKSVDCCRFIGVCRNGSFPVCFVTLSKRRGNTIVKGLASSPLTSLGKCTNVCKLVLLVRLG